MFRILWTMFLVLLTTGLVFFAGLMTWVSGHPDTLPPARSEIGEATGYVWLAAFVWLAILCRAMKAARFGIGVVIAAGFVSVALSAGVLPMHAVTVTALGYEFPLRDFILSTMLFGATMVFYVVWPYAGQIPGTRAKKSPG